MNKIAIIPARGGSKRIPRKNIKLFDGKPMIYYAISAAKSSGLFDQVVVSTDDQEISVIALSLGAEVPFLRPKELSDDHTPTVPVIAHAIDVIESDGTPIEFACCIYPNVPFIQVNDLINAYELLKESSAAYSFPITEFPSPIQRCLIQNVSGTLSPLFPEYELIRTQDLQKTYHDAGQFYWGYRDSWFNCNRIHSSGVGLVIPNWRVVDIDTPEDWARAELLHQSILK